MDKELEFYKAIKSLLTKYYSGRVVLIKGHQVIGDYDTFDDALVEGYKRFYPDNFFHSAHWRFGKSVRREVIECQS